MPQAERLVIKNEERGATGGIPLSITSCSSSKSSGLASIDLTQEILDEESREHLKGKLKWLESKLKKERKFHRTILVNYENEAL